MIIIIIMIIIKVIPHPPSLNSLFFANNNEKISDQSIWVSIQNWWKGLLKKIFGLLARWCIHLQISSSFRVECSVKCALLMPNYSSWIDVSTLNHRPAVQRGTRCPCST